MTVDEHSEMTKDITEYRWNITPLAFTQKDGRKISVAWLGAYWVSQKWAQICMIKAVEEYVLTSDSLSNLIL